MFGGWSTAAKWGLGGNLAGMALGGIGSYLQGKAEDKAMSQANAAMDQYNSDMAAWRQREEANSAAASHAAAMARYNAALEQYNKERAAELAVLKDQGATMEELREHDKNLAEEFMGKVEAFGPEAYNAGVAENTQAAQEEGEAALAEARAERPEVREGASDAFKEAAAQAMAQADAKSDNYLSGMTALTGRTRARDGESAALRGITSMGLAGERAKAHIQEMAELRQRRLGYIAPQAPIAPSGGYSTNYSDMPQEPNITIPTSNTGNWMTAIGSLLGTGANIFGTWNRWKGN